MVLSENLCESPLFISFSPSSKYEARIFIGTRVFGCWAFCSGTKDRKRKAWIQIHPGLLAFLRRRICRSSPPSPSHGFLCSKTLSLMVKYHCQSLIIYKSHKVIANMDSSFHSLLPLEETLGLGRARSGNPPFCMVVFFTFFSRAEAFTSSPTHTQT